MSDPAARYISKTFVTEFAGTIEADPKERVTYPGDRANDTPSPALIWTIPYSHAERLAEILDAVDSFHGTLETQWAPEFADEAKALTDALDYLVGVGVLYRNESGHVYAADDE